MALNAHEVTNGNNDLLDLLGQFTGRGQDKSLASLEAAVDLLKSGDGEGSGFTGTRLSLSNDIVAFLMLEFARLEDFRREHTLDDRHNSALLDSRRALETISVDTCTLSASCSLAT